MGSISWIERSALGVLSIPFSGGTALERENAGAMERFSIDGRAENPHHDQVRDANCGDSRLRRNAKSGMVDWGTGGFEARGELVKWVSRSADTVRPGRRWQGTYAAAISHWEHAVPGIAFEAGARLERTSRGVAGGPLLSRPTRSLAQMAYVGAEMTDSSFIKLFAFDNGEWSKGATGELMSRIANGERAARKGAAIEIGRFESGPGNARRKPQFKLRVERGRIAARPDPSGTISCEVRL